MCQYVGTEQFMGAVAFCKLKKKDKKRISLKELNRISTIVKQDVRKNYDTVLSISSADIFTTISNYASCFSINNYSVIFKGNEDLYDSYFLAGMFKPVRNALESAINKIL